MDNLTELANALEVTNIMKSKTVILYGHDDVLGHSVELFLSSRKDWKVIKISDKHTLAHLLGKIDKVNPDVVILHQGSNAGNTSLPAHLMKDHVGLKVITFNLENNSMEVYNKQRIWVKNADDLLSVIEESS
jgi:hypothetical protein